MAYYQKKLFVDPNHLLTEAKYNDESTRTCAICLLKLAGQAGYCCNDCDIHIHKACADFFKKFISFFAHPHTLELIRSPSGDRVTHLCNLCREGCPPASFVYRCTNCDFDLHPLCSLLPEAADSLLHPGHQLRMITSPTVSCCSACHQRLPLWHYVCSCSVNFKLHIRCALDMDNPIGDKAKDHDGRSCVPGIQGSHGATDQRGFGPADEHQGRAVGQQGNYYGSPLMLQGHSSAIPGPGYGHAAVPGFGSPPILGYGPAAPAIPGFGSPIQGYYGCYNPAYGPAIQGYGPAPAIQGFYPPVQGYYGPAMPGQSTAAVATAQPSFFSVIAKFLLNQSFHGVMDVATDDGSFGSPLVELLSGIFDY